MSLALLFHYLLFNVFRMIVHPSSGACDLFWIYFMCCIALVRCVLMLRKLLKMNVLTFETCWAVNSEIIKHVTSSWSIFIQIYLFICSRFILRRPRYRRPYCIVSYQDNGWMLNWKLFVAWLSCCSVIWPSEQSKTCKTLVREPDISAEIGTGHFVAKSQERHIIIRFVCLFCC